MPVAYFKNSHSFNYFLLFFIVTCLSTLLIFTMHTSYASSNRPVSLTQTSQILKPLVTDKQNTRAFKAYQRGDYKQAYNIWISMAKNNDAKAMNNLGILHEKGLGVSKSLAEAAKWFKKSAEGENLYGMNNYAKFLKLGYGTVQNEIVAAQWFRIAAEKGLPEAQFNLALLYDRGIGLKQNSKQAAAWYSRAAAQDQPQAQTRLGKMYAKGRGVDKNMEKATLLLYGASMHGDIEAIKGLEELAKVYGINNNQLTEAKTILFSEIIESTNRKAMRKSLAKAKVKQIREDNNFICDVYDVESVIAGATEMALCYGADAEQNLGFVKISYFSPNAKRAKQVTNMVQSRFGVPSAKENENSVLWNLGKVIVATQYSPSTKETGLMYIVPKVYHLTKKLRQNTIN